MQASVCRALYFFFDRIREALAHDALTAFGRARAFVLEPSADAEVVQASLELTSEAVRFRWLPARCHSSRRRRCPVQRPEMD